MTGPLTTEMLKPCPTAHSYRAVSKDSWWVYRHKLGSDGLPLPWGRVVYYCRSEKAAKSWILKTESTAH